MATRYLPVAAFSAIHLSGPQGDGIVLWIVALVLSALCDLIRHDRDRVGVRLLTRRLTLGLGFYLVVVLAGLLLPTVAVFGYLLIALRLLIPTRHRR